jgi:hypothetical protein
VTPIFVIFLAFTTVLALTASSVQAQSAGSGFANPPSLTIAGLDPSPGSRLRSPVCDLMPQAGATQAACPTDAPSTLSATVSYDTGGKPLFIVGLLDGSTPAQVQLGLDAGAGRDALSAVSLVEGTRTAQVSTGVMRPYYDANATTTRLRVRLCDVPHDGPGGVQLGPCYVEVASDPYPLAPLPPNTRVTPPPDRPAPDAQLVAVPLTTGAGSDAPQSDDSSDSP